MSRILPFSSSKANLLVFCLLVSCVFSLNLERQRVLVDEAPIPSGSPSSYDWRNYTTITPVKNQSDCNAYYAFSSIAFFEQDLILNQGASTSIDLSQQFLITCLPNGGCVGGNPKDAMNYAIQQGGIPSQKDYPYSPWAIQAQDICYPQNVTKVGTRPLLSFWNIGDQQFLKSLILKQPLNVYVCSTDLKTYAPTSNSDRTLSCNADNVYTDHTVLLIGYTDTQWIIKNSWGTSWGLGGFGYISRNAANDCCIGSQVFLRGKQTTNCSVANCDVCVENTYCSVCKPGYFVTNVNNTQTCTQCNYANCAECENNVGYCKTCIYGYALYFPQQVCQVSTIPNCKSIVNGGCNDCHDGYKVNANFTCDVDCKISNCQVCKDTKSCSSCKSGFNLVYSNGTLNCIQNKCKLENCNTCNSQGKCLTCVGSYQLVEEACVMICNKTNCQQCSTTQDICAVCLPGYALDYYSHECVVTTVSNCNVTYLTKYCSVCQDGYTRSDSWEQCNKNCAIDNCKTCQAGYANQCTVCNDGYTLKTPPNQTIAQCFINPCNLTNCSLCNAGGDTCVKCIDNYHSWDSSKNACVPYVCPFQNCAKCQTNSTKCQQCNNGTVPYIPTGGCTATTMAQCIAVGVSSNGTQCWNCNTGYHVDYSTWKSCIRICNDSNCLDCSDSPSFCKKCPDGYGVKNISDTVNMCVKIPTYLPNCLLGNSDQTICYQCKQFYFFNSTTASCQLNQNCPKDCVKCTGANQTLKCECKSGLAWDFENNVCVLNPSDSQCLVVSNYTGTPQCFECQDGYTLTQDGKGCTSDCSVDNCLNCVSSSVEYYPDYCQVCNDGYVVNLNLTKCLQCQVNFCKTCQGPTQLNVCTECKVGYQLNTDGTCSQIPCQKNAVFNGLQCACSSTFYKDPSTQQCKNCITSCQRCNSSDTCLQCLVGFYLSGGKCLTCLENCQSCSDSKTCDACNQGYTYQISNGSNSCVEVGLGRQGYFVLANGKKARCSPGCASCAQSQLSCQQCLNGYILEGDICIKCGDNCLTCYPNILNACKTCQIGFLLVDGNCTRCQSDQCLECPVQTDICTSCLPGYYVKDQTCISCGVGCLTCNADGTCNSCHTGFAMVDGGYCEQCLDGCAECSGTAMNQCMGGCLSGTYRSGDGSCVNCPSICISCTGAKLCTECIPGYDLVSGVCQKWCTDSNCFDCSSNSDYCKECYAGYEASDGKCVEDLTCNNSTKQSNTTTNGNSTTNTTNKTTTNTTTTTNNSTTTTTTTNNSTTTTNNSTTTTNNSTTTTNNSTTTTPSNTTNTTTNNTQNNSTTNSTTNNTTNSGTSNSTNTTVNKSGGTIGACQVCPKKYYLSSNFSCLQCTTTDPNCISCTMNSPSNCTQCAVNYYLSQDAQCVKCADNCLTCRSQQYCYICNDGFYMVQESKQYTGNCAKCDDNCLTCVGEPKNCLSCKPGYTLSVANFCMDQDLIKFNIRLDMPFSLFSEKLRPIRMDINSIIQVVEDSYMTQFTNSTQGSTIMDGYVSCASSGQGQCTPFNLLKQNLKSGSYIGGYKVISTSLQYNGNKYDTQPDNGTSDGGIKGWVIAVIVIGAIVAIIVTAVIISLIVKKVKQNRAEKEEESEDEKNSVSLKQTEQNLKKENPQLK